MNTLTITHKNSVESIINAFVSHGHPSSEILQTLVLLARLEILTPELFQLLQQEGYLSSEHSFDSIKALLIHTDLYYHFPQKASDYLRKLPLRGPWPDKIDDVLLSHYEQEMNAVNGDMPRYKLFFKQALLIYWKKPPEALGDWLSTTIASLAWNKKEYDFLEPLVKGTYNNLSKRDDYFRTVPGKLIRGILLVCLGKINLHWFQEDSAINYFDNALQVFDEIEKQVKKEFTEEDYKQWTDKYEIKYEIWAMEANLERMLLYNEHSQFSQATQRIIQHNKYSVFQPNNIMEIGRTLQSMGDYQHAEAEWLKLEAFAEEDGDYLFYFLYEISKYYSSVRLFDDAIRVLESHLAIDPKSDNHKLWRNAVMAELAVVRMRNMVLYEEREQQKLADISATLYDCIRYFDEKGNEKLNVICYLWLARALLYQQKDKEALAQLEKGSMLLLNYQYPGNKTHYEYYITYADYLKSVGSEQDYEILLHKLYNDIQLDLGACHPLVFSIIDRIQQLNDKPDEKLKKHYDAVEQILNSPIRVDRFVPVTVENPQHILNIIRSKKLSILPSENDQIGIEEYILPFYSAHRLIQLTMKAAKPALIRYYLYEKNDDDIRLMDKTNKAIYKAAEKGFTIRTQEDACLYIHFFMESVEGAHGKFLIVQNGKTDIPWRFDISEEERIKEEERITTLVKPLKFLFTEEKKNNEAITIYWHYAANIIFKNSLFSCKLEINGHDAVIRMYDDDLLIPELPVTVDLRSSLKGA